MIDHNAWVGHWPFRDLGTRGEIPTLLKIMEDLKIEQSWVSPLDGIFHRVPHVANRRLFAQLTGHTDRLKAVPMFHPGLADASDYLKSLQEINPRPVAIRIYPAMHEADIGIPDSIFEEIAASGFPVLLTHRLVDARARHPRLPLPELSTRALTEWVERLCATRVILTGCSVGELRSLCAGCSSQRNLAFDISFIDGASCMQKSQAALGEASLLSGSNAPLLYQEAMVAKEEDSVLP